MAWTKQMEASLERAFALTVGHTTPPRLCGAMKHAVFPGGARVRPRLVMEVGQACGLEDSRALECAAAAVEFVHCASLVHDDLPCFDDAATRRGKATVHRMYGESMAVLVGDGLIVAAFSALAQGCVESPRLVPAVGILADAVGANGGLVAGQGWEEEVGPDLHTYHRAKTAALFEAGAAMGALVAGADPAPWRALGAALGEAYQIADDIRDATATQAEVGKPVGQDALHGRPSAALHVGVHRAEEHLAGMGMRIVRTTPECPGRAGFQAWLEGLWEQMFEPQRRAQSTRPYLAEPMAVGV